MTATCPWCDELVTEDDTHVSYGEYVLHEFCYIALCSELDYEEEPEVKNAEAA